MSEYKIAVLSPVARERHNRNLKSLGAIGAHFDLKLFEVHGHSEVSRARQDVASKAYHTMVKGYRPTHVFWWDADMVGSAEVFSRHLQAVVETGLCISGRYVRRQARVMAANVDNTKERISVGPWNLRPVFSGMGCLLMPVGIFLDQLEASPQQIEEGKDSTFLICAPRIEQHAETGHCMVSEDHDYCRSIPTGVWYASREGFEEIDYGHMGEGELLPTKGEERLV